MKKIGIFFGTDTGNTEKISKIIQNIIGKEKSVLHDISSSCIKDFLKYDTLILGVPTWYYGEVQSDWDDFLPELKKINFYKKKIAIFGCGDQEDYGEYFCDAMKIIYKIVISKGAKVIGKWPNKNYSFEASKSLLNKKNFLGLVIDEDRQPELTKKRTKKWIKNLLKKIY
ncbi:MAG: flavodoxin FldA [Buchnera aphidicola (Periphyllus lyropictus)]|uniref:flavodoxin FldA n=1 Tax=Buchnera aphidicola TaxID=9 RepID=UPI001EC2F8CC|nr:flavodoxin FldA [Buchnera aphidicola]NIH16601.1 flavodoxin FldA [Buchnera aphidicola (Periphyllus lyropictus)]USS94514.1 flavodoxin FldA [Buchnera aphidicola (Periphyllus lyropictus)]